MQERPSMEEDRGMGGYSELESQKPELKTEGTHWVADLFPPRFTVLDLLEGSGRRPRNTGPGLPESGSSLQLAIERRAWERSRRVQEIYRATLQEAHRREGELKRERLSERIVREAEAKGEADPGSPGREDVTSAQSQEAEEEEERCIWTQQDLRALRGAVRKAESERRALEARLGQALAEGERLREERTQLRGLLDEREGELARSQRAAAQQALRFEALRAEGRRKDAELEARAAEARDRGEEGRREPEEGQGGGAGNEEGERGLGVGAGEAAEATGGGGEAAGGGPPGRGRGRPAQAAARAGGRPSRTGGRETEPRPQPHRTGAPAKTFRQPATTRHKQESPRKDFIHVVSFCT